MDAADPSANHGARHPDIRPVGLDEIDALFADLLGLNRVLAAVSGGSDSMALLYLLSAWRQEPGAGKPEILVATIDHGLRPASADEARWVADQATAAGLPHRTIRWIDPKPQSGLQAAAREARYRLLVNEARSSGCDAIVLGHTLDDQAETVLMRLARGSGVDGLSAMQPLAFRDGLRLARPLLSVPKSRLVASLDALGKSWREDPSNTEARFERVRLRNAQAGRDALGLAATQLARSARRLSRAREALDHWAGNVLREDVALHDGSAARLDAAKFVELPDEIALRVLHRLLWAFGGQEQRPRLTRVEALLAGLRDGRRAATLGGCEITQAAGHLIVTREFGRSALPATVIMPGQSVLWDRRFLVMLDVAAPFASGQLEVRSLGRDGVRFVKQHRKAAQKSNAGTGPQFALPGFDTAQSGVSQRAWLTLPAIWDGLRLVAVPHLGQQAPDMTLVLPWQERCRSWFEGRNRLWETTNG